MLPVFQIIQKIRQRSFHKQKQPEQRQTVIILHSNLNFDGWPELHIKLSSWTVMICASSRTWASPYSWTTLHFSESNESRSASFNRAPSLFASSIWSRYFSSFSFIILSPGAMQSWYRQPGVLYWRYYSCNPPDIPERWVSTLQTATIWVGNNRYFFRLLHALVRRMQPYFWEHFQLNLHSMKDIVLWCPVW